MPARGGYDIFDAAVQLVRPAGEPAAAAVSQGLGLRDFGHTKQPRVERARPLLAARRDCDLDVGNAEDGHGRSLRARGDEPQPACERRDRAGKGRVTGHKVDPIGLGAGQVDGVVHLTQAGGDRDIEGTIDPGSLPAQVDADIMKRTPDSDSLARVDAAAHLQSSDERRELDVEYCWRYQLLARQQPTS